MTAPTVVQCGMLERTEQIERTAVTQHHKRKTRVNPFHKMSDITSNCVLPCCSCSISRTLRQITPRQKEPILLMLLSYFPPDSFSSVAQQGPKSSHLDVSTSHTHGRRPLKKWSARRRDPYLTTHNKHNRQHPIRQRFSHPQFQASSIADPRLRWHGHCDRPFSC